MTTEAAVPELSVVIPIHNEEGTVAELHKRLTAALVEGCSYEIVFVDDRSTDDSWPRLVGLASDDPSVRLLRLSRNFGHQLAITAGLEAARGRAVVMMD